MGRDRPKGPSAQEREDDGLHLRQVYLLLLPTVGIDKSAKDASHIYLSDRCQYAESCTTRDSRLETRDSRLETRDST